MATATDLEDIIDIIQGINRGVPGIVWAPPLQQYPLKADTAPRPLALTWPTSGTWGRQDFGGKKRIDDVFSIFVYVEPLGQGQSAQRIAEAARLLSAFRTTWLAVGATGSPTALADPVSAGDIQVTFMPAETADSGIGLVTIGGVEWTGFEVRLSVRELW